MILNELSIVMGETTKQDVKNQISIFLQVCHKLIHKKEDELFYYTKELLVEPLCENYTVHDWLKDTTVERREKDFFRSLINRGKLLESTQFLQSEMIVRINNKDVATIGCLVAYEWDNYVVSFTSDILWMKEYIDGVYSNIEIDDCDNCDVKILNCSKEEQADRLIIHQKRKESLLISSGSELWDKRQKLFPHLIFCESVRKQLEEARVNLQIKAVINRIQILEDYFSTYEGVFDKDKVGHGCRYESDSVQSDERLKNMRKFVTPYGEEEYFYWHISFPGNYPGRIHFFPDPVHNIGIVGYIGKHLPTKKYQTI